MNIKRILAAASAAAMLMTFAACGGESSKTSYKSDDTSSKASDNVSPTGAYDSSIVAAKEGPVISFSNVEAAPGEKVGVTMSVKGADMNWNMCGIHITYGDGLECIVRNKEEGFIEYSLGDASEYSTGSIGMLWESNLPKALTDNHLGCLFFTEVMQSDAQTPNMGQDGIIATFFFNVPKDAKSGTVYPIGIYYMPPTEQREDMFRNTAEDRSLEKFAFENWIGGSVTVK
jgi:hypothetical protein